MTLVNHQDRINTSLEISDVCLLWCLNNRKCQNNGFINYHRILDEIPGPSSRRVSKSNVFDGL